MSLLDTPPHLVVVQNRTASKDSRGQTIYTNVGDPVDVHCSCQPLSASESNVDGLQALTKRFIVSRTWPGDILSTVIWGGFDWDVVGDPQHLSMSPATDHWEIVIEKRGIHV